MEYKKCKKKESQTVWEGSVSGNRGVFLPNGGYYGLGKLWAFLTYSRIPL